MRHGEAVPVAQSDPSRALTARGQADAVAAGQCLKILGWQAQQVLVSPYLRAQQTMLAVTADAGIEAHNITTVDWLTPDDSPTDVLAELQALQYERVMLVSHQPLVSRVIGLLTGGLRDSGVPMMPASMALLRCDYPMLAGAGLVWLRHAPAFNI